MIVTDEILRAAYDRIQWLEDQVRVPKSHFRAGKPLYRRKLQRAYDRFRFLVNLQLMGQNRCN
jgi:hypothetical protein